jgi:predicted O-methyltransferase YrrM
MAEEQWSAVDRYLEEIFVPADPVLDGALERSRAAGLPAIDVSPSQGKLLHLLALLRGARRILEIGTLGGYSAIWLARALPPGGRLVTLEVDPNHARIAAENLALAGVADRVEIVVGPALETLPKLEGPFDFVFIDADKASLTEYVEHALALSRPGTAIVIDNVIRKGQVIDGESDDPSVRGVRRMNERLAREPRLRATAIQTVGRKGYDGFTLAVVD